MIATIIVETVRRRWTSLYFYLFTAAIILMAVTSVLGDLDAKEGLGPAMLAFFLAFELIGPEASAGSLQLAMARPIRRSTYLLARYAGVVLSATLLVLVIALASLITAVSASISIEWQPFLIALLATIVDLFFPMAVIAFFGAFTSSFANVLLFLFYSLAVTLASAPVAARIPRIHSLAWPELMPRVIPGVLTGHLTALSNSLIVLFLAALLLNRRELGYGRD
jgi:ABC-type transport system involved in multi-copper enzyme maturation permease subunit